MARHRRPPWLAGGLVLAALVGGTAAVLWRTGSSARRTSAITANSVAAISPAGNAITAVVRVGFSPSGVAAGAGAVWVSDYSGGTVERIDAVTHAVQVIQAGSTPSGLAVGGGAVWVTNNLGGTVSRIDPTVDRIVQTTSVGNGPSGLAIGDGSVWVANGSDGTLTRIDAVTGHFRKTIALGGGATDVAVGFGAVWVSDEANGRVLRIDPQTNQVTQSVNVGGGPSAIAVGDGSVWVANSLDGTVSRIDPQSNRVAATITVGNGPGAIAVGAGGVWVANEFGRNVVRVDPSSESVAGRVTVGNRPRGLALAGGLVWVGAQTSAAAHRGGTMTVLQNAQFGSIDPARAGSLASVLTLYMTNDGLTAFKRVGGADGAQVVPDLAVSLPTPTSGGLTYTFQLRSGVRYSNGQRVMPEDFRRAIERDLKLGPGAPTPPYYTYYENIVGGAECVSRPSHCDLTRGIVPDDRRNSITFHLVHPDPEFPAQLALWTAAAAAPGSPGRDIGNHPLPATGSYEVSTVTPRVVTLVRNPYFHEWSHAAQPDGYPDRIVWRIGGNVDAAVSAVERGAADYTLDAPPAHRLGEVHTRFASQLNVNPNDVTIGMGLNTRTPPFTDVRVRRALSYALDRGRLAQLLGQDSHPTCQLLPPYILGYQSYCPYTLNPNTAGEWSAPDLGKARALIAASGSRGTPVTIWSQPAYMTDFTATGQYLASLLSRLGYPTHIKTFSVSDPSFPIRLSDSRTTPQAFLGAVVPNYPSPSEFLGPQLESCQSFIPNSPNNNNLTGFCDRRFDSTVSAALAAEAAGSPNAAQLWANADREFTDQAPILALVTPSTTDFVSHRVGNYQYNPQLGVMIDQLWVR